MVPGPCNGVACADGWEGRLQGDWTASVETGGGPASVAVSITGDAVYFPESCGRGPNRLGLAVTPDGSWYFSGPEATWSCPVTDATPHAVAYQALFYALRDSSRWQLAWDAASTQLWVGNGDGAAAVTLTRPT